MFAIRPLEPHVIRALEKKITDGDFIGFINECNKAALSFEYPDDRPICAMLCDIAIDHNKVEILKWLVTQGAPISARTREFLLANNGNDLLEWVTKTISKN